MSDNTVDLRTLDTLDFAKAGGLLPAIVIDSQSGAVRMLGYMNRQALESTLQRGRVVFYSRRRQELWEKGETSGNALRLVSVHTDCDRDALLVRAQPAGPTCHLGADSCFASAADAALTPFLCELEAIIASRLEAQPQESYTARLGAQGVRRVAQKLGEEGVELALAAASGGQHEVLAEAADLLFHLMVLLKMRGLSLETVVTELRARHAGRS
jgi:phosphoribosyl-AMP cyclohydrolase / phosphoribosyl-ATP pyrophosphohydrolase